MNLGVIIQARSGSKRLPKKIFKKIGNKTVIEHVIDRVKSTKFRKKIIVATTKNKNDRHIFKITKLKSCLFFAGDNKNVLRRFYFASKKFHLKHIIRVSADSPFLDPTIIEKVYRIYVKKKHDYVSNIVNPTFPKGMSCEIFSFKTLELAYKNSKTNYEKEHVTPFIIKKPKVFKIKNFSTKLRVRKKRFSIDYKSDLIFLRNLYIKIRKSKKNAFSYKRLVELSDKV